MVEKMKFKIIKQNGDQDCGSACVSMILANYFEKNISIYEIRPVIKNTQNGTSFGDIEQGMSKIGIFATTYRVEKNIRAFAEMTVPLITQIEKEKGTYHYILVNKVTSKSIYYADPEISKIQKKSIKDFMKIWVPYIIQIDLRKSEIKLDIVENLDCLKYKNLFLKIKGRIISIVLLSIISYIVGLFLSSMYTTYFDVLIPNSLIGFLSIIMIVYLFSVVLKFLLNFFTVIISNSVNKELDQILSNEFFQSLFRKSPAALEYFGVGETINTLSNIISIRQKFFILVISIPMNIALIVSSFIILVRINILLSLLLFSLVLSLVVIVLYSEDRFRSLSKSLLQSNKKFNDGIIDTFTNTEMIKQYNQEDYFIKKGNKLLVSNLLAKNNLLNFDAKLTGLKSMALDVFNVILFTLGSYLIIKGSFVTGTLLMYNSIISFTVDPILSITNLQSVLSQGKEAENLLLNLLGSDLRFYGKEKFPTNEKNIALKTRNLQFSFNSREPLLDGINITIENQKNIALTGGNGSGKSTLGKLLSRSYLPDNGVIEINGIDISSISEEEYKTNVVYVGSSEDIISGTIIENISLGKNLDLKKLEKIAHDINLDSFIDKLQNRYETPIGNSGVKLSLGQKQLIKIVRSTIQEKQIYIFDEITNGLDKTIKPKVINYLTNLDGIKIFITHDEEIMNICDQVISIESINDNLR